MKLPLWAKIILGIVVFIVALFIADYLMGFLFLLANKANPFNATLTTFYEYWYYYGDDPLQKGHFRFAIAAALILTFIAPPIALEAMLRQRRSLHGDARWATSSEVRASGLLSDGGIIVGKFMGKFLVLAGQLFVMLAAPTRGGKGVGIVIPNYLSFGDSIVGLDVKQENFDITSGYRKKYGQEVYLFNPFAEDGRTHRWNPLSYVSDNPHYRVSDILAIGYVLYPAEGKDSFFNDQARNLFMGLVLYLMETPELPRTVSEALRQSSGKGKPIKQYLLELIAARDESERPLSDTCVEALTRFTSNSDNTLASILASFNAPLTIWANPIVDAATSANDFFLTDVRKKRMTIYLGVTPDKLSQAALIMNLFFSQVINLNTKELPQKNPALKYQCLLLMDEFTAPGKIDIINSAVSYMAGYGLRLLTIIQSMAQLSAPNKYGEMDARTLSTNHALHILFPPREQKDANEYSETLGTFTEKSVSTSMNQKSFLAINGGNNRGENISDQKRALMMPQELREMGQDKEIVILENTKPIMAEKVRYYKEPLFIDRLKEVSPTLRAIKGLPTQQQLEDVITRGELAAPVPVLDLDLHVAMVETRKRYVTEADIDGRDGDDRLDEAVLAHNFDDLPELDDAENPSPESVSALVNDFFSRLEDRTAQDEPEGEGGASGGGIQLYADEDEIIDGDGVITTRPKAGAGGSEREKSPPAIDLSVLDNELDI